MFKITKPAAAERTYAVRFDRTLEEVWEPGDIISLSNYRRPTTPNGFEYECTDAGQTGSKEPDWPTTIGATIDDGSVEWTCRDMATNATDTIASHSVTVDSGLTKVTDGFSNDEITFKLSGGTIGNTYDVNVEGTTDAGEKVTARVRVTIVE